MNVLVPVQYPLTEMNRQAIRRGQDLTDGNEGTELLIFHLNQVLEDRRVSRKELRAAVESAVGEIDANYVIRDGFFVEEAVIEIAIEFEMDMIVLSEQRRNRWQRLLSVIFGIERDPEEVIEEATGIEVTVIRDPDAENSSLE
ncbi:universal stress protein [Halorubrum sp. CSM-61]|uniref:universal stress protein n=1 Tax=Halorubrum sp. CSM-61 TaxID=2485838 RepID=UPI000F4B7402|nr:universal stress protein [Halorubrum sp. CSM-61]